MTLCGWQDVKLQELAIFLVFHGSTSALFTVDVCPSCASVRNHSCVQNGLTQTGPFLVQVLIWRDRGHDQNDVTKTSRRGSLHGWESTIHGSRSTQTETVGAPQWRKASRKFEAERNETAKERRSSRKERAAFQSSSAQTFAWPNSSRVCVSRIGLYHSHQRARKKLTQTPRVRGISHHEVIITSLM